MADKKSNKKSSKAGEFEVVFSNYPIPSLTFSRDGMVFFDEQSTTQPTTQPKFNLGQKVGLIQAPGASFRVTKVVSSSTQNTFLYECIDQYGNRAEVREEDITAITEETASKTKPKKKIPPRPKKAAVTFESVIIANEKRKQIVEALEQHNQHDLIFEKWGFGETIEKGKGVSFLFYGPPGTGKTLMAQAIANKLKSKLTVIATADIESSAPGEAERNIRKHFKEAKENKNILLFDECDSLIYARQNVGPIMGAQVNELLSQLERFHGVTIFTTNRLGTLDEAVNRRLALKLEFDMPTRAERALIWQRMFPKKAPLSKDIDWNRLAIIEITGGYIKNAVLRAARMAAAEKVTDSKKKIQMRHLVEALQLETRSMIEFQEAKHSDNERYGHVTGPDGRDASGHKVVHKVQGNASKL